VANSPAVLKAYLDISGALGSGKLSAGVREGIGHVALNVFTNYINKAADTDIDWPVVRHDH
jgi:hypothetical protein